MRRILCPVSRPGRTQGKPGAGSARRARPRLIRGSSRRARVDLGAFGDDGLALGEDLQPESDLSTQVAVNDGAVLQLPCVEVDDLTVRAVGDSQPSAAGLDDGRRTVIPIELNLVIGLGGGQRQAVGIPRRPLPEQTGGE